MTTAEVKLRLRSMMNGALSRSMREKGLGYRVIFGVEWPRLVELSREIGKDYHLAQALWKEDIRECRLLAGLLMPPEQFLPEVADIWVEQMRWPEEAQFTVMSLMQYLPYASQSAFRWIADGREMFQLAGFLLLSRLFMRGDRLMRQSESEYLDQAAAALLSSNHHVRKAAYASLQKYALLGDEPEALAARVIRNFQK